MSQIRAGVDIGKEHHHCVVVDERGERLLSRRVFNDEPALLELIADVLALSEDTLWAVDINHGGAALLIGLLLSHQQLMVYITGLAVHQASAAYRGQGKTDGLPEAMETVWPRTIVLCLGDGLNGLRPAEAGQ